MNYLALSLTALCVFADASAADVPTRVTKTTQHQLHIERELLDFFDQLREQDPKQQRQLWAAVEPLKIPERELDIVRVPTVNLWYPSRQTFGAVGGILSADSTYLLILPVGSTRGQTKESVTGSVIAEFHVAYKAQRNPSGGMTSNTLTMTFRGFRLARSQP
ncbi:MAG TPA: hypothetical protein VF614_14610 [Chthoniobacteraceae bacterium]|jgi:hypothetical protein